MLGFGLEGIWSGTKRKRGGETVLSHVLGAWRELDQGKEFCLHLAEPKWINMLRKLIRYIGHYVKQ